MRLKIRRSMNWKRHTGLPAVGYPNSSRVWNSGVKAWGWTPGSELIEKSTISYDQERCFSFALRIINQGIISYGFKIYLSFFWISIDACCWYSHSGSMMKMERRMKLWKEERSKIQDGTYSMNTGIGQGKLQMLGYCAAALTSSKLFISAKAMAFVGFTSPRLLQYRFDVWWFWITCVIQTYKFMD